MMISKRLLFAITIFLLGHNSLVQAYALPYDNVPISAKTWEEIDLIWYNKFNPSLHNTAKLLRPVSFVNAKNLVVGQLAKLNMSAIGIPNSITTVAAIKPLSKHILSRIEANTEPVIGYFKHYVNDVRTYRFRSKDNNYVSIHTTPNHPFWVKSLHKFRPISKITSSMALAGKNNETIYLICAKSQSSCGQQYYKHKIAIVYNIEVYRQHVYRVSNEKILVHNKGRSEIIKLPIIGSSSTRDVHLDAETQTIYKLYRPNRLRSGPQDADMQAYFIRNEAGDTRLNQIYRHIWGGKYRRYARFRNYVDNQGYLITEGPFIEGRHLTSADGFSEIEPVTRELGRYGFVGADNKPNNYMKTPEGDVIPTDAKHIGMNDRMKRPVTPRTFKILSGKSVRFSAW